MNDSFHLWLMYLFIYYLDLVHHTFVPVSWVHSELHGGVSFFTTISSLSCLIASSSNSLKASIYLVGSPNSSKYRPIRRPKIINKIKKFNYNSYKRLITKCGVKIGIHEKLFFSFFFTSYILKLSFFIVPISTNQKVRFTKLIIFE